MSRVTLDIIGLAGKLFYPICRHVFNAASPGFNYKFNALSDDPEKNELMEAFSILTGQGKKRLSVIPILKAMYPALRFLVRIGIVTSPFHYLIHIGLQPAPNDAVRSKAAAVMKRIGTRLLKESKGNKSTDRKNVLSVLIQANTLEEKSHQMKDEDVLSRAYKFHLDWCIVDSYTCRDPYFPHRWSCNNKVHTSVPQQSKFLISESWLSVTMSWALYALSQNKQAQTKLREEISNISTDNPTMDDLNGLPYMDAVVRETLRLYPALPSVLREAKKDDCIPLSTPFTDRKGIVRNDIR